MDLGWIKLHRKIIDNFLYPKKEFSRFEAWIDLLLISNHKPNKIMIKNETFDCMRGQTIRSIETYQKRWSWTAQKVRSFFELLKKNNMIEIKTNSKTTILTICNYDSYQSEQQTDNKQITNGHQTDNKHLTTNKNEKNENNENNEKNIYIGDKKVFLTLDEFSFLKENYNGYTEKAIEYFQNKEKFYNIKILSKWIKEQKRKEISNDKNPEELYKIWALEIKKEFESEYNIDTLRDFVRYWGEWNKNKTKMKWQLQKTFEVNKRLVTWRNNEGKFNPKNNIPNNESVYEYNQKIINEMLKK
ncbi:MAG: hypothetical protein ACRC0V_13030 [Fusobacteriaceae bacterium]